MSIEEYREKLREAYNAGYSDAIDDFLREVKRPIRKISNMIFQTNVGLIKL